MRLLRNMLIVLGSISLLGWLGVKALTLWFRTRSIYGRKLSDYEQAAMNSDKLSPEAVVEDLQREPTGWPDQSTSPRLQAEYNPDKQYLLYRSTTGRPPLFDGPEAP